MSNLKSPLVKNGKTRLVDVFDSKTIIENYEKVGLDVKRLLGNVAEVKLFECVNTGYRFYYPFSIIGDALFYEDLSRNRKTYYSDRWEHGIATKYIRSSDELLEVGSGFGAFLKRINQIGVDGKGIELNPYAVEMCVKNNLNVVERLVEQEAEMNPERYDVVCSFQVLEHISDVHAFLESCVTLLKKGGKLIIGVPNNNPYLHINDKWHTLNLPPHHAGLWDKKSLNNLTKVFPLELLKLEYEPLEKSYSYFIKIQINNHSNKAFRFMLKELNNRSPILLKKMLAKTIKGRNVLAIYTKN